MKPQKQTIVTYPEWGSFMLALDLLLRDLGVKTMRYRVANNKHLETGIRYSPETICFCFKPFIGGILEAVERGANVLIMYDTHGLCRVRYYPLLQDYIFKRLGHKVDFFIFDGKNLLPMIKRLSGKGSLRVLKSIIFAFRVLKMITSLDQKAYHFRPREANKGETTAVYKKGLKLIEECRTHGDINRTNNIIDNLFANISVGNKVPKKILVLGEMYIIHDEFANHGLLRILGELGFEVIATHGALDEVFHKFITKHFYQRKLSRVTKPYLDVEVGGHGRENVMELLVHQKQDLAGVIHVGPFGCMPEVTVKPIIQSLAKKSGIPYLYLSFDNQTSDTGLVTRLEAFADLVQNRDI